MSLSDSTIGRIELGAFFAIAFYGASTLQIYTYSQMVWKDPLRIKLLVAALGLIETLHSGFCIDVVYHLAVTKFKQHVIDLDPIYWGEMVLLMLSVLTAFVAHCFFTLRTWHVTKRNLLVTLVLAVFAFLHLLFGILSTFPVFYPTNGTRWSHLSSQNTTKAMVILTITTATIEDILLAAILGHHVYTHRPFPPRVNRTWRCQNHWAISTVILNAILSVVTVIIYASLPHDTAFLGLTLVQSKIHANSVLAYLNTRPPWMPERRPPLAPLKFTPAGLVPSKTETIPTIGHAKVRPNRKRDSVFSSEYIPTPIEENKRSSAVFLPLEPLPVITESESHEESTSRAVKRDEKTGDFSLDYRHDS